MMHRSTNINITDKVIECKFYEGKLMVMGGNSGRVLRGISTFKVITNYSESLDCYSIICCNCDPQTGSMVMAANDDLLYTQFIAQHLWTMVGIHQVFTYFPLLSIPDHRSLAVNWQKVECTEITP
jgi:hypothetical protein